MRKQVVILAGGLGTRLRPLTETCPKPMVQVAGQPYLHWQLADLRRQGYTDVVLLVAYLGEQIRDHFEDGSSIGMSIEYVFEGEPLGTGGALANALEFLEDDFVVINGDSFLPLDLDSMVGCFEEGRFDALVAAYPNDPPTPVINNLQVRNQIVVAYEKGGGAERGFNAVDAGVYVLKKSIFLEAERSTGSKFQLEDVFQKLIPGRRYGAYGVNERFYDIGTPERLGEFESYLLKRGPQ